MRTNTGNMDIRQRLAAINAPMWKLAKAANVCEITVSRWLREDLQKCDPRRTKLLIALSELEKQSAAEGAGDGTKQEG